MGVGGVDDVGGEDVAAGGGDEVVRGVGGGGGGDGGGGSERVEGEGGVGVEEAGEDGGEEAVGEDGAGGGGDGAVRCGEGVELWVLAWSCNKVLGCLHYQLSWSCGLAISWRFLVVSHLGLGVDSPRTIGQ